MDIAMGKNITTKNLSLKEKLRLAISFLVITLILCLLVYAIVSNEPIVLFVVIILIVKIIDITLNFYKIRRKTQISNNSKYNRGT